jgi:hypothetical protein
MGPLTTGWATHYTRCWRAVPLSLARRGGLYLLCVRLHGLRPPTTSMLTAAGLWQQSVLQRRGVVTHCWCDSRGGYPPSFGEVYSKSMPSGDCSALCGGFQLGDLPSAIQWLDTVCIGPGGGPQLFHHLKGWHGLRNIRRLQLVFACQKKALRFW